MLKVTLYFFAFFHGAWLLTCRSRIQFLGSDIKSCGVFHHLLSRFSLWDWILGAIIGRLKHSAGHPACHTQTTSVMQRRSHYFLFSTFYFCGIQAVLFSPEFPWFLAFFFQSQLLTSFFLTLGYFSNCFLNDFSSAFFLCHLVIIAFFLTLLSVCFRFSM